MEQGNDLSNWKKLLTQPESNENDAELFKTLTELFIHLVPFTAPRLQSDYEACTIQTIRLLETKIDEIDLSDRDLLIKFLNTLLHFGYFRLTQITHRLESSDVDFDCDTNEQRLIYTPTIVKSKWYDLEPLLPKAGTVDWKGLLNHGLTVDDTSGLLQICIQLLLQKLHYYAILMHLERYQEYLPRIMKNGSKVAAKLIEIVKDSAYGTKTVIALDSNLYRLIALFCDDQEHDILVDALVEEIFKPFHLGGVEDIEQISSLLIVARECMINLSSHQDIFINKFIQHLKINVCKKKRRRDHEDSLDETQECHTITSLIESVLNGDSMIATLALLDGNVSLKGIRITYISYWIGVLRNLLIDRTLNAKNATNLITCCLIILVSANDKLEDELSNDIISNLVGLIENTSQNRLDKFFQSFNCESLRALTKIIHERTAMLRQFRDPINRFYDHYFERYTKWCVLKISKTAAEEMFNLLSAIFENDSLDHRSNYIITYSMMQSIAICHDVFRKRSNNKVMKSHMDTFRLCCEKLFRFIRKHTPFRHMKGSLEDNLTIADEPASRLDDTLMSDSHDDDTGEYATRALICIIKISIEHKDAEILTKYADLLYKLSVAMANRFNIVATSIKRNTTVSYSPLDAHMTKLLGILTKNAEYLDYDLQNKLCSMLVRDPVSKPQTNGVYENGKALSIRKETYNQIKTRTDELNTRGTESKQVYSMIINKQYNLVTNYSNANIDIKREDSCCKNMYTRLKLFKDVAAITLNNCKEAEYSDILVKTIDDLENCDPLNHPRVLAMLVLLEAHALKRDVKAKPESHPLIKMLPRISVALIKIYKTVELGPSIHIFKDAGGHRTNKSIQSCTYSTCIKIYTLLFLKYPPNVTKSLVTDAMQTCVSSNLSQYGIHRQFLSLSSSIASLLKAICLGHKDNSMIKMSISVFLSVMSNLMRCTIIASSRHHLNRLNEGNSNVDATIIKEYEQQLELIALDVARTLNNLTLLRVKLVDYAPHLISSYVEDVQKAACPDYIRTHLDEGVFRVFNLVDAHQKERQDEIIDEGVQRKTSAGHARGSLFDMIHARLNQPSREIFRHMYENYNRFHRFLGKC